MRGQFVILDTLTVHSSYLKSLFPFSDQGLHDDGNGDDDSASDAYQDPDASDVEERFSPRCNPRRATQPVFPNHFVRDNFRESAATSADRIGGDAAPMMSQALLVVVTLLVTSVAAASHEGGGRLIRSR